MDFSLTVEDTHRGKPRETTFDGDLLTAEMDAGEEYAYLRTRHKLRTHCERRSLFSKRTLRQFDDPFEMYITDVRVILEASGYYAKKNLDGPVVDISTFGNLRKLNRLKNPGKCPCYSLPISTHGVDADLYPRFVAETRWGDATLPPRLRYLGVDGYEFNAEDHPRQQTEQSIKNWLRLNLRAEDRPFNLARYRTNLIALLKHEGVSGAQKWFNSHGFNMSDEEAALWYRQRFGENEENPL